MGGDRGAGNQGRIHQCSEKQCLQVTSERLLGLLLKVCEHKFELQSSLRVTMLKDIPHLSKSISIKRAWSMLPAH